MSSNEKKMLTATQDVCVGGLACRFPEAPSTAKFWQNLVEHVDMVTENDAHWPKDLFGPSVDSEHGLLPPRKGTVTHQDRFDNFFFKMSGSQAQKTDPQLRFLLELSYEALVDSNLDFNKVCGSEKVGVYVGSCFSDAHKGWLKDVDAVTGYENTGCAQSMYANRLSYFYNFGGPSLNVDTACSSSLVAFSLACQAVESGECDVCLVGGSSITLHPGVSVAFGKLGMLSRSDKKGGVVACKAFSREADGYARSEGVAVVVVYREDKVHKYCRNNNQYLANSYMRVLSHGINSDGFTPKGITFPNGEAQYSLYSRVRSEAERKIAARRDGAFKLFYLEAHGTGTGAGDSQELEAIRKAYSPDTVAIANSSPFYLGSVKSNMGHAEGASGLAGLVKLCLSFKHDLIPANLHYTYETRNPACDLLNDKSVCQVVENNQQISSKVPAPGVADDGINGRLCAISSFGFGGTNAHAVFESRVHNISVSDKVSHMHKLPDFNAAEPDAELRISPMFGRSEEGVTACLTKIEEMKIGYGDCILGCPPVVHNEKDAAEDFQKQFPYIGFKTASGEKVVGDNQIGDMLSGAGEKKPVWLVFSGNGGMWPRMGLDLYHNSTTYKATMDRSHKYLKSKHGYSGLEKYFFVATPGNEAEEKKMAEYCSIECYDAVDGVCGLTALQCALVDVLKQKAGVEFAGMLGHSAGEIACGYADGCLTLEETLSIAYYRGVAGKKSAEIAAASDLGFGGMFAAGLPRADAEALLKKYNCTDLSCVGCDNDPSLVTLSGCLKELAPVVAELNERKILCRQVPTFGVAYHSGMLETGGGLITLREELNATLGDKPRRLRSSKWKSTCYDEKEIWVSQHARRSHAEDENTPELHAGNFLSADYHLHNFRKPVEFYKTVCDFIPDQAIVVEIGPSGLFRGSLKKLATVQKFTYDYVCPMSRGKNGLHTFQKCFGDLIMRRAVKLPVVTDLTKLGVPLRQTFIQWDHKIEYPLPKLEDMMVNFGANAEALGIGFSSANKSDLPAALAGIDSNSISTVDYDFDPAGTADTFILDHMIDGGILFPACGYVHAAWEGFYNSMKRKAGLKLIGRNKEFTPEQDQKLQELTALVLDVCISDVVIHQGIRLDPERVQSDRKIQLHVMYKSSTPTDGNTEELPVSDLVAGSHQFEVYNGEDKLVSGTIRVLKPAEAAKSFKPELPSTATHPLGALSRQEFYGRISRNGYDYQNTFQAVRGVGIDDSWAQVEFLDCNKLANDLNDKTDADILFTRHWISYLDNLLQLSLLPALGEDQSTLRVPTGLREMVIKGSKLREHLKNIVKAEEATLKEAERTPSGKSDDSFEKLSDPAASPTSPKKASEFNKNLMVSISNFGRVSSEIANFSDMKTSIMARNGRAKDNEQKVVSVVRKELVSSAMNAQQQKLPALVLGGQKKQVGNLRSILSYVKEQYLGGEFSVLDCVRAKSVAGRSQSQMKEDVSFDLSKAFIKLFQVESFDTFFVPEAKKPAPIVKEPTSPFAAPGSPAKTVEIEEKQLTSEEVKEVYSKQFNGLFEVYDPLSKDGKTDFDVFLVDSLDVGMIAKLLSVEKKVEEGEEKKPQFVIFHLGGGIPADEEINTALQTCNLIPVTTLDVPEIGSRVVIAKKQETPEKIVDIAFPSCADVAMAMPAAKCVFLYVNEETFECGSQKNYISKFSAYLHTLLKEEDDEETKNDGDKKSVEKKTKVEKVYIASTAAGFPGFVRCIQREPELPGIRGIQIVNSANFIPRESFISVADRIQAIDARFCVLDAKTGDLLAETEVVRTDACFPAPFGRFLTFPESNGNLEGYKWKAQPHPEVTRSAVSITDEKSILRLPAKSGALPSFSLPHRTVKECPVKVEVTGSATFNAFPNPAPVTVEVDDKEKNNNNSVVPDFDSDKHVLSQLENSLCQRYYTTTVFNANPEELSTIDVAYAALNFRDVMLAYNKIDKDALVGHSKIGDGFGLEFAGYLSHNSKSKLHEIPSDLNVVSLEGDSANPIIKSDLAKKVPTKVIGLSYNSLSSQLAVGSDLYWALRPDQDLKSFATVPCVYSTCYYALLMRGGYTPESSVLIHAGAGGVGQAALYITLKRSANPGKLVFTTCSAGKRDYLMEKFGPLGLKRENIGNSRNADDFEQLIMDRTDGRGVDMCLNSLSDEKLMASVRCVAQFGRFLEIGKYDLMKNTGLGMHCLLKNVSIVGIDLDQLLSPLHETARRDWKIVYKFMKEGLESGEVVPLDVGGEFGTHEVTEAFRFMGGGTHVGKVVLRFDETIETVMKGKAVSYYSSNNSFVALELDGNTKLPSPRNRLASGLTSTAATATTKQVVEIVDTPQFTPQNPASDVYVIIGGLGGFGLELSLFLAKKGVRKIVLSTRRTVQTSMAVKYLIAEIGARYPGTQITVVNHDFSKKDVVRNFVKANNNTHSRVAGFFNLGMVLADGLFNKMNEKQWETPILAKKNISENFHQVFSELNQQPDFFVTYSSVSAGLGNAGQSNYGYANSCLDTLIRERNSKGMPGLSVQWGAIGDVGILAGAGNKKSGLLTSSILPQELQSCLTELEKLLVSMAQGVWSIYVTPVRSTKDASADDGADQVSIVDKILGIVGVKVEDVKESANLEALGADSLQTVEVQTILKLRAGKKLGLDKIAKLTVKDLKEIQAGL